jgi:hypothetical protein
VRVAYFFLDVIDGLDALPGEFLLHEAKIQEVVRPDELG